MRSACGSTIIDRQEPLEHTPYVKVKSFITMLASNVRKQKIILINTYWVS